ncbi:hypothetical protein BSKO_03304 [Bryopsis sp. KO-2023]|nr:hypothetical protein BSKO_03304 [Bryopsis sp. KO-2023]
MGSYALDRMNIRPEAVENLAKLGVTTVEGFLCLDRWDLLEILEDECMSDVDALVEYVSRDVATESATVYDLLVAANARCVPTSLDLLDQALGGGIPRETITELVGPAGVGKTQLCFTLSLVVAAGLGDYGQGKAVIYIDTEKKFSCNRLTEILREILKKEEEEHPNIDERVQSAMEKIMVVMPENAAEVLDELKDLETNIVEQRAGLVVLDSVAALVSGKYSRDELIDRQDMIGQQATKLKAIAEKFKIPILVTNQVMASFREEGASDEAAVTAALGTKWAHAINTRLALEGSDENRLIKISKSPNCPHIAVAFEIGQGGIKQHPEAHISQQTEDTVVNAAIENEVGSTVVDAVIEDLVDSTVTNAATLQRGGLRSPAMMLSPMFLYDCPP